MTPEYLNYQRRPPMTREYRWYANIADIEFRQQLDITALLRRVQQHMNNRKEQGAYFEVEACIKAVQS